MLKGKRHIVIKRDNEALERFVIESIQISKEKNRRVKTVTAYSYENILKNFSFLEEKQKKYLYIYSLEDNNVNGIISFA